MPAESEGRKPKSNLLKAEKWRRRAEECRAESTATADDTARRAMTLIARFYDELASLLETQSDRPSSDNKPRRQRRRKR
jgi:hypothetical protein